jgi:hypothetical protein
MKIGHLLILFVVLNAVLYSALLPLWEGFDEPFHFGYVQRLANGQGFPDVRTERLSREVGDSILLAPASQGVKANLPQVVTYSEFFSWPPGRRAEAQRALYNIPRATRWQPSQFLNYEAHHAPLEYMLLAVPERLLAGIPIPSRILWLRILTALACSLLLFLGAAALCSELGIGETYRNIALFCIFSSQMIWATLAHIANDSLGVALSVWLLVFLIRCARTPTTWNVVAASLILAAGLLTKAYFVAFLPLVFGTLTIRREWRRMALAAAIVAIFAAPWYARNYRLYGVVTATQEARNGIGLSAVLDTAPTLNWPKIAVDSVHAALWTANNTFRSFQLGTINTVIALSVAGLLLWVFSRHALAEWVVAAWCAIFLAALAYSGVTAHIITHGGSSTPCPWHDQVLVAPLLILAVLGTARRRGGFLLASALALVFGYVLAVTYVVKLIPLYAGYDGRGTVRDITTLYGHFGALSANLGSVTLAPASVIFGLTAAVEVLIVTLEVLLVRGLLAGHAEEDKLKHVLPS